MEDGGGEVGWGEEGAGGGDGGWERGGGDGGGVMEDGGGEMGWGRGGQVGEGRQDQRGRRTVMRKRDSCAVSAQPFTPGHDA